MRHNKHTFKIGRSGAHRKAMMANMLTSLFTHGRIKTTVVKAKELKRWADKMITSAKIGDLHNRRKVISTLRPNNRKVNDSGIEITDKLNVVQELFDNIAPRYKNRNGGYTRIIRISTNRAGDNADLCFVELVEEEFTPKTKTAKKSEAAKPAKEEAKVEETAPEAVEAEETEEAAAEETVEEVKAEETAETAAEETVEEVKAEETAETVAEETPAEEPETEKEAK